MGRKTLFIVTTAVTQPQAKNSLADRIVLLILSLPPHDTVVTAAPYRAEEGKYRQLVRALPLLSVLWLKGPPEWQAPFPVRILQPYVVIENHSGGATRLRKKFDDIFICSDTIPACDRHITTAIAMLCYALREQKLSEVRFQKRLLKTFQLFGAIGSDLWSDSGQSLIGQC